MHHVLPRTVNNTANFFSSNVCCNNYYLIEVLFNNYSFSERCWREGTKGIYDFKWWFDNFVIVVHWGCFSFHPEQLHVPPRLLLPWKKTTYVSKNSRNEKTEVRTEVFFLCAVLFSHKFALYLSRSMRCQNFDLVVKRSWGQRTSTLAPQWSGQSSHRKRLKHSRSPISRCRWHRAAQHRVIKPWLLRIMFVWLLQGHTVTRLSSPSLSISGWFHSRMWLCMSEYECVLWKTKKRRRKKDCHWPKTATVSRMVQDQASSTVPVVSLVT